MLTNLHFRRLGLSIGLSILLFVGSVVAHEVKKTRILFIASYDVTFPTFSQQLSGIQSVLDIDRYDIHVEFIDSKRIPGEENLERFAAYLGNKLQRLEPYEVVITADDNALHFIDRYKAEFFPDTPVVFFGVNNVDTGTRLASDPLVTGVIEYASFQENLDLMWRLFPLKDRYYIILDALPSTKADWEVFKRTTRIPPGVEIIPLDLSKMSFLELHQQLESLGERDAVLLLAAYMDVDGVVAEFYESVHGLIQHCTVPIFHPYQHGVGEGLIGGMVVSHFAQSSMATEMAVRILKGEPVSDIPMVAKSPNQYLLDARLLKQYRAEKGGIPPGALILNPSRSIWVVYRKQILVLIFGTVFLLILTVVFNQLWIRERSIRKQLLESETRSKKLFENPFAIMLVLDPENGNLMDANDTALKFYGYSKRELLKLSVFDLNTRPKEEVLSAMQQTTVSRSGVFRMQHRLKTGEIRDVEISSGPIVVKEKTYLFSIIKDITDRIRKEQQLVLAKEEAVKANRAKDEFLSMMSHEMRTPLNPIIGFLSVMMDESENEELKEPLKIMYDSAHRLNDLIDDVLQFNKLNQEIFRLKERDFRLASLFEGVISTFEGRCDSNEVLLRKEGNYAIPEDLWVHGEPDLLVHIICNFIGNACKFTTNGSIEIRPVILQDDEKSIRFRVDVEDNGVGIEAEKLHEIFEPFVRVGKSKTETGGVGLGLAISKKMADSIGGEIEVRSELGKGSCFSLVINLEKCAGTEEQVGLRAV